jgi:ABC-type transporter MlaC component
MLKKQKDETFKFIDIVFTGISVLQSQKSEFSSLIERKGFEALLEFLRKRPEVSGRPEGRPRNKKK